MSGNNQRHIKLANPVDKPASDKVQNETNEKKEEKVGQNSQN